MPSTSQLDDTLTQRQQRERAYYDEYAVRNEVREVPFDPVLGSERRPWNPYWTVYQTAVDDFQDPQQKLLDFGCGAGAASMRFLKIGYDVHGFDISENNIRHCQRLAEQFGFADRAHFSVQTAEQLQYDDDTFDMVVGIDILHHIEIQPAIREVRRVLKPGGLAVFREFVEVPIFDNIRNTKLVRWFFPNDMSLEDHRTHDEKKLSKDEVGLLRAEFPNLETRRFCLTSRLHRIIERRHPERASRLERLDHLMLRVCPPLGHLGGEAVFLMRK